MKSSAGWKSGSASAAAACSWRAGRGASAPAVGRMLPVEISGSVDWDLAPALLEPTGADLHPVWRLFEDERATRAALGTLPESLGRNNWVRVKPQSGTLLGAQKAGTSTSPLLAVGAYG